MQAEEPPGRGETGKELPRDGDAQCLRRGQRHPRRTGFRRRSRSKCAPHPRTDQRRSAGQRAVTSGTTFSWSGSGVTITRGAERSLVELLPSGAEGTQAELTRTASSACGQETETLQIPILVTGASLTDGVLSATGERAFPLVRMLRGERFRAEIRVPSKLTLYDFQGRVVATGDTVLDVRLPVRGSYFLRTEVSGTYTLTVAGVGLQLDAQLPEQPGPAQADPTLPDAAIGRLQMRVEWVATQSYGKDLIRSGTGFVATWYDESQKASIVRHYLADGVGDPAGDERLRLRLRLWRLRRPAERVRLGLHERHVSRIREWWRIGRIRRGADAGGRVDLGAPVRLAGR